MRENGGFCVLEIIEGRRIGGGREFKIQGSEGIFPGKLSVGLSEVKSITGTSGEP